MTRQFQTHLKAAGLSDPAGLPNEAAEFALLEKVAENDHQKSLIHAHRAASYRYHEKLSEESLNQLLVSAVCYKGMQERLIEGDPSLPIDIEAALSKHHSQLLQSFINVPHLPNLVAGKVMEQRGLPRTEGNWEFANGQLVNGLWTIDIASGRITHNLIPQTPIPLVVREHPRVKALNIDLKEATLAHTTDNQLIYSCGTHQMIASSDLGKVSFAQKFDGIWHDLLEDAALREQVSSAIGYKQLVYQSDIWVPREQSDRLLLMPKEGGARIVVVLSNGKVQSVLREGEPPLELADTYSKDKGLGVDVLHRIENVHCLGVWQERGSKEASLLELPRFGTHFRVEDVEGKKRAVWSGDADWFIAPQPLIRGLGTFTHYIVLQNREGQRRVLIAREPLNKNTAPQDGISTNRSFLGFEYDPLEKKLNASTIEGSLYLAYLSLVRHDYDAAAVYLSEAENYVRPYQTEEQEVMQWIFDQQKNSADNNPKAIALRLRLTSMMAANRVQFPRADKGFELSVESISNDYEAFLDLSHTLSSHYQLSYSSEFTLLRLCSKGHELGPRQQVRLKQLEELVGTTLYQLPAQSLQRLIGRPEFTSQDYHDLAKACLREQPVYWDELSLTRCRPDKIVTHFKEFYLIACNPEDPHYPRLKIMIDFFHLHTDFWMRSASPLGAKLALVLHHAMRQVEQLPPFPAISKAKEESEYGLFGKAAVAVRLVKDNKTLIEDFLASINTPPFESNAQAEKNSKR
jgi:hypothetical protein